MGEVYNGFATEETEQNEKLATKKYINEKYSRVDFNDWADIFY